MSLRNRLDSPPLMPSAAPPAEVVEPDEATETEAPEPVDLDDQQAERRTLTEHWRERRQPRDARAPADREPPDEGVPETFALDHSESLELTAIQQWRLEQDIRSERLEAEIRYLREARISQARPPSIVTPRSHQFSAQYARYEIPPNPRRHKIALRCSEDLHMLDSSAPTPATTSVSEFDSALLPADAWHTLETTGGFSLVRLAAASADLDIIETSFE